MSITNAIKGLFQKQANTGIFGFFSNQNIPKMGEKEYVQAYRGWAYACTNAIAEKVAEMELTLQKKNGEVWEDLPSHPAVDIIYYVNDFMSYHELMFGTQAFQELDGNSFWYLVPAAGKAVSEIWPLDPTRMTVVKSSKNFIGGYIYVNEKGEKVPFKPTEILHFKRFSPTNPFRGVGTVEAAAIPLDIDKFASEWQRNFFGNAAMPAALLTSDNELTQEQYDRIMANWKAKYQGVANAHKLAIMEGGIKYTSLSPTAKEMEFTQSRKDIRDEILAIFRVPKTILGITEDVNFASAQASEYVFSKYIIKPKMNFILSVLNENYLPLWGLDPKQYRFSCVDPVPENIEQKLTERVQSVDKWKTRNEIRAEEGLPPVEGGDELYTSTLQAPISGSNEEEPETQEQDDETEEENQKKVKRLLKKERKIKVNRRKKAAKATRYIDEQTALLDKSFVELNDKLKSMLLANLKKKVARVAVQKVKRDKDEASNDLVRVLFADYPEWVGLLYNATKEGMQRIMQQSGTDALAEVDVDQTFDLQNPRAMDWLNTNSMSNSKSYSDTMKEQISLVIAESTEGGAGVDEIATNLGQFFSEQGDWRALRLARTETVSAYSAGNLEGYKQSGVVSGKEWLADASACIICAGNADAGTIAIDDDFPSGDPAPVAHPNCECALQPVTKSDEELFGD